MVIELPLPLFLECGARGIPQPSIEWVVNGTAVLVDDRRVFVVEDPLSGISRLEIYDTTQNDSGVYSCRASNDVCATEYAITVTVQSLMSEWEELRWWEEL